MNYSLSFCIYKFQKTVAEQAQIFPINASLQAKNHAKLLHFFNFESAPKSRSDNLV